MNPNAAGFDPNRFGGGQRYSSRSEFYPTDTGGDAAYNDPTGGYGAAAQQGGYPPVAPQYHGEAVYQDPSMDPYAQWTQQQEAVSPGYYYPTAPLAPQLYGAPISALAYDDQYAEMYVASHTQPSTERRHGNRASMLVTHSTLDGTLYSSCAGHPEASRDSLCAVYETFFGGEGGAPVTKIPPRAYRPPYGYANTSTSIGLNAQPSHIGITTLLPAKGYVASVSPSAVRVHSHGGLCMSDQDIEGMVCGTPHPNPGGTMTHISVGGMAIGGQKSHVHCMDLYQGLRIVSSNTFRSEFVDAAIPMGVMGLATNYHKQTIVAGCSDGTIRLLDGSWRKRGGSELAKIKSHSAGVSNVAVSCDGNLICTTGFSSRPSGPIGTSPYAYPDQHLLVYDVRYLGRGGIAHPFSGIRGGPRLVSFLPDIDDQPTSRILVASGQNQGGLQIITPFDNTGVDTAGFLVPQLTSGESITAMTVSEERLALGTSKCNVLQYELQGFDKSSTYKREPLISPSYTPKPPAVSIPPGLLRSSTGDIFSAYVLCKDPSVSKSSAFARLAHSVLVASSKRNVSSKLTSASIQQDGDFMATMPVVNLDVDLMENHSPSQKKKEDESLSNPNKLLYARSLSELCYDADENRKRMTRGKTRRNQSDNNSSTEESTIPPRYRLTLRPTFVAGSHFDHTEHNTTGLWPGWDYSLFMPNSFAVGVLVLMYFEPQVRVALLARQLDPKLLSNVDKERASALGMELGFIFNQIENISKYALAHPGDSTRPRIGVLTPVNFMTTFAVMPEAVTLALADGSAECVDRARRPEAFYRFLLYHLDKELSSTRKRTGDSNKLLDSLQGVDFISANEFISGSSPPTLSSQRQLTVDLAYEPFLKAGAPDTSFGEVLRHALCRETRLRAWSSVAKTYETIVQRKVATSLPKILSLSCACAGRKEEEGLSLWRGNGSSEHGHWLPEYVKIDMESDGNITVHELVEEEGSGAKIWRTIKGRTSMPLEVAKLVSEKQNTTKSQKYRLDAVLAFVRDDTDPAFADQLEGWSTSGSKGHHVLHIRQPSAYKRRALQKQSEEADRLAEGKETNEETNRWTLTANTSGAVFRKRSEAAAERLEAMSNDEAPEDEWVLFNGFVVSDTVVEDARSFHMPFKEPSLVVFRAISDEESPNLSNRRKTKDETLVERNEIPLAVMHTSSMSTGEPALITNQGSLLPTNGDLIAFDAEFVSVQEEESVMTDAGTKVTVRETRYALARISVLACKTGQVVLDDHVLPREPVVDYLTRFSGIVAGDLDPKLSPHHLISTRSAYLKLRYLQELGCIFVGHGLSQDFLTANLFVPPSQIIDTVNIYHKPNMRFVSLRFLTNFVLKRDMQQDVHDSVEDARAAWELLLKAQEFQAKGSFEQVLQDLYEYGQKVDWKVGVDDDDEAL